MVKVMLCIASIVLSFEVMSKTVRESCVDIDTNAATQQHYVDSSIYKHAYSCISKTGVKELVFRSDINVSGSYCYYRELRDSQGDKSFVEKDFYSFKAASCGELDHYEDFFEVDGLDKYSTEAVLKFIFSLISNEENLSSFVGVGFLDFIFGTHKHKFVNDVQGRVNSIKSIFGQTNKYGNRIELGISTNENNWMMVIEKENGSFVYVDSANVDL